MPTTLLLTPPDFQTFLRSCFHLPLWLLSFQRLYFEGAAAARGENMKVIFLYTHWKCTVCHYVISIHMDKYKNRRTFWEFSSFPEIALVRVGRTDYGRLMKPFFFHRNPKLLGLFRQFGHQFWGIFDRFINTILVQ